MDNLYNLLDELNYNIYEMKCLLECVEVILKNNYDTKIQNVLPIIDLCLKNNRDMTNKFDDIERIIYQNLVKICQQ